MSDVSPALADFQTLAKDRRVIAVHRRLLADTETAVGLYAKLSQNRPGTYLLESAEQGVWARYSFIGVRAAATLIERDGQAVWTGHAPVGLPAGGDPLEAVRETLKRLHTPHADGLPPFTSGLVGYLSYDAVRRVERLPDTCVDDLHVPELGFLLAGDLAVLDHQTGEVWLIANAINFDDTDERVDEAYADAVERVEAMTRVLAEPTPSAVVAARFDDTLPVRRQRTSEEYQAAVAAAVEAIKAGEAFQIVVSQRFEVDTTADALDIYRVLRLTNPSPYMYLVAARTAVRRRRVVAGGTGHGEGRPRHRPPDSRLQAPWRHAGGRRRVRDRAAGRPEGAGRARDAGRPRPQRSRRVCKPGTVEVVEFMEVRRYSHIMHLEATVVGQVAPDRSALDVLLASFPAGTLSGAPKVRAMEIIDGLEVSRRGLYGGVVGYLDFAGDADAAIAIRTALLRDGVAYIQAGAGIVADSHPPTEDQESQNKAAAVVRAISVAADFTPHARRDGRDR